MPNFSFLAVHALYHLGLAVWIGGTIALGALVAPDLFRRLPRHEAGAIFGSTLRKFARIRLGAIVLVIVAAGLRFMFWEKHSASVWILARWIAIAALTAAVLYEIAVLEPALEARRLELSPDMAPDDPRRQPFQRLHRRAEALMKACLLVAGGALFLS
jgi:uncharacterized membrane protein